MDGESYSQAAAHRARRVEGKSILLIGGGAPLEGLSNGKAAAVVYAREVGIS